MTFALEIGGGVALCHPLSGTTGFYIIFVDDRLDYFGQLMISYLLYSYGKPGWSYGDDNLWKYRFRGRLTGLEPG